MIHNRNDEQKLLIDRCLKGDEKAYKILYELYANAMYNIAFRLLQDRSEAEDIVQELFIDVFAEIQTFEYRATFGSWVKRILINKCINHLKKKKIIFTEFTDEYVFVAEEGQENSHEIELEWEILKIKKGIGLLPAHYRMILSLYLIEGYDHQEIAEITGSPEATIRTQYRRAKGMLIRTIQNELTR